MRRLEDEHEESLRVLNERVKREVLGLDEDLELLKEQILEEEVWVEHLREKEEGGEEEKGEEGKQRKGRRRRKKGGREETNTLADRMTESSRRKREHIQPF